MREYLSSPRSERGKRWAPSHREPVNGAYSRGAFRPGAFDLEPRMSLMSLRG